MTISELENLPVDTLTATDLHLVLGQAMSMVAERQGQPLAVKEMPSGRYVHANAAMLRFLGCSAEEVVGRQDSDLFDASLAVALRAADQTALAQADVLISDHKFERSGARFEYSVSRATAPGPDGRKYLCCAWTDQAPLRHREAQFKTALAQLEQQQRANDALRHELKDQSLRDGITGLYQRAHFNEQLRREADLSAREQRQFALVLIAIDPSNASVQAQGEPGRVRVQEALGRLLRSNTRAMDVSARLEDNLYAVVLSGVGLATAHSRMDGLRKQCASHIVPLDGVEMGFTVSMGVASYPHTAENLEDLQRACETALKAAQARGGNHQAMAGISLDNG